MYLLLLELYPLHDGSSGCGLSSSRRCAGIWSGTCRSWPGREFRQKKKTERLALCFALAACRFPFPSFSTPASVCRTMPTRGLRPSLARTHSRSSSGTSSKVVLNLQLTSKDPVQSKIDKARRTSHTLEVRHHFLMITSTAQSERRSRTSFTSSPLFHLPFSSLFYSQPKKDG